MSEIIETSEDGKHRVVLEYDEFCESPVVNGDWWSVSVIYLGGRRYESTMIALHDPEDRLEVWTRFAQDFHYETHVAQDPDAAFIRYMSIFHGIKVYEVGVGSDGTRGLAWVEPSERERVGLVADDEGVIKDSLDEYNAWARGECYAYRIEELAVWDRRDLQVSMETWEPTDDELWGLVGYEYAEQQAREALKVWAA